MSRVRFFVSGTQDPGAFLVSRFPGGPCGPTLGCDVAYDRAIDEISGRSCIGSSTSGESPHLGCLRCARRSGSIRQLYALCHMPTLRANMICIGRQSRCTRNVRRDPLFCLPRFDFAFLRPTLEGRTTRPVNWVNSISSESKASPSGFCPQSTEVVSNRAACSGLSWALFNSVLQ